jgi:hypothetical protein
MTTSLTSSAIHPPVRQINTPSPCYIIQRNFLLHTPEAAPFQGLPSITHTGHPHHSLFSNTLFDVNKKKAI